MAKITQNSILRISDVKTLQLIELYEKEQCLWNTSLDEYKNKAKRMEAAQRIAKSLALPQFSTRHVITKFKNLRNSYCQELKKVARRMVYQPKVFWFQKMDSFLRPHLQSTAKDTKLGSNQDLDKDGNIKTQNRGTGEEWNHMSDADNVLYEDENSGSDNMDDNCEPRTKRSRTSSMSSKIVKTEVSSDFEESTQFNGPEVHAQLNVLHENEDSYTCFGKYVTAMLKSMPTQKALELQPMIVSLLVSGVMCKSEAKVSQSDERNS